MCIYIYIYIHTYIATAGGLAARAAQGRFPSQLTETHDDKYNQTSMN